MHTNVNITIIFNIIVCRIYIYIYTHICVHTHAHTYIFLLQVEQKRLRHGRATLAGAVGERVAVLMNCLFISAVSFPERSTRAPGNPVRS